MGRYPERARLLSDTIKNLREEETFTFAHIDLGQRGRAAGDKVKQ